MQVRQVHLSYLSSDTLIQTIETASGTALSPEEQAEIELWRKGRDLSALVIHPGWKTVLEMLQSYATSAAVDLVNMRPGDERTVVQHAVAYALNDFYVKFRQDVDAAVDAAKHAPGVMKRSLKTPIPIESMY